MLILIQNTRSVVVQKFLPQHLDLNQYPPLQQRYFSRVFGELNMQPANGFKFWSAVESAMERNLDYFSAAEIVDLLLSFAFLGHYSDTESNIAKTVLFDAGKKI